ncbi:uncharacterized protein LOC125762174 [Anopheles funestus]|uniref:Protein TsetseEP domain-containing protein n=1 Tax=Anopheles funestus TaxID=62324 RepID=A0A182RCS8_ANOFN|nr:uncharacterized protein LOC125762174 [Anopheles funestus]
MASSIALVVTFLWVLQNVTGRPDFGLNGDVAGSSIAIDTSGGASFVIGTISEYRILLGSQYQLLYDMEEAYYSVAEKFTAAGIAVTDKLSLLADDDSGIVTPPFESTISAIADLQTVISNDLTQEFLTLQFRDQPFITDRLTDSFSYISVTLTTLDEILETLQSAAEQAQFQSGGDEESVDQAFARKFVTPHMINSLLNTIVLIPGAISPLIFSVHEPLAQLDRSDTYIIAAKSDIESTLLQAHQEVVNFNGNIRKLKQDTNGVIETLGSSFSEELTLISDVLPTLQLSYKYQNGLATAIESFNDALSMDAIDEKTLVLDVAITEYVRQSKTFDDDLVTVYGERICPAMQAVVQVLIASGPYATYCFKKYSHRVIDLAIHNFYDIGECYELELNRLYATHRLISNIVSMVMFNFLELYENLNTCAEIQPCPVDCDPCVDTLGELLETLSRLTDEMFNLILQIIPYETTASLQRLKSCAAFSKYKLIADAHDLVNDVFICEDTGYNQTE